MFNLNHITMNIYGMWDIIPTLVRMAAEKIMMTKVALPYNHIQWVTIWLVAPWFFFCLLLLIT